MQSPGEEQPLVYRHLIVKRKGFAEKARPGPDGKPRQVTLGRRTFKNMFGMWPEEMEKEDPERYARTRFQADGAVIVATITKEHIPGGNERLPSVVSFLTHPAKFDDEEKLPEQAFLEAAGELQAIFKKNADQKFRLLSPHQRDMSTLVTVAYTPIMAYPLAERGFMVGCEFHQVTRMGRVDASTFEVYSDEGQYPIAAPNTIEMKTLMLTADEISLPPVNR